MSDNPNDDPEPLRQQHRAEHRERAAAEVEQGVSVREQAVRDATILALRQAIAAAEAREAAARQSIAALNAKSAALEAKTAALNAKSAALEAKTAALNTETAALKAKTAALNAETAALKAEAAILRHGTYYATIDREYIPQDVSVNAIWTVTEHVVGTPDDFEALQRPPHASRNIRVQHWISSVTFEHMQAYQLTEDILFGSDDLAVEADSSRSSDPGTEILHRVFPRNIFGHESITDDVGHLVPVLLEDTNKWWFTADWLLQPRHGAHWTKEARLRALHGSRPADSTTTSHATGIKNLCTNRIKLYNRRYFFDENPCFVLVPIMTVEQARQWTGEAYSAIALMGAWENRISLECVAHRLLMTEASDQVATEDQVQTATNLLRTCLKAIHYAVKSASDHPADWPGVDPSWLRSRTEMFERVAIPNGFQYTDRVRKISFKGHGEAGDGGHWAPDPILLLAKAAISFAIRQGTPLIPPATPEEDGDWSEGDEIAAEQYMAWRESMMRPSEDMNELARQLGQPIGYGDDSNNNEKDDVSRE